jgi:hypothetical protein
VVAGIVVGWLAGSVVATVALAGALRRLGARDARVVPVRTQAGATAPAPATVRSVDVAAVVAYALFESRSDDQAVTSRRATSRSEISAATAT